MLRCLIWIGSSKKDLLKFPEDIRRSMGYCLYITQKGERPTHSKILKGFGGAGVIEIIESDASGTFRVVYTIKISQFIFVLHAFQKKSKQGIKTPLQEIELIKKRLKEAMVLAKELHHEKEI